MFESTIAPIRHRLIAAGGRRLGGFGSFARSEQGAGSDVDVLVSLDEKHRTFDNLFNIGEALEEAFARRVDLVTEESLSSHLRPHILRDVRYVDLDR